MNVAGTWLPLDEKRLLLFYAGSARPDASDPLPGSAVRLGDENPLDRSQGRKRHDEFSIVLCAHDRKR